MSPQSDMTPKVIVQALDKHIVGQAAAKRAVAIALRNRYRRMQLDEALRNEISPKNILLIGPTGVGKTEIARRLAKLAQAPFIKVEATKFTEVGYVGRDVESIIRDLVDISYKMTREAAINKVKQAAELVAEDKILDALTAQLNTENEQTPDLVTRQTLREQLIRDELDEQEIEIEVAAAQVGIEIMAPPGMEEMTGQLQGLFESMGNERKKPRRLSVKNARRMLQEEAASDMINEDEIRSQAVEQAEQHGIVFIDELDKVARSQDKGHDVSREGVQRDLLPLVEGCTVSTRYGMIKSDHVLFIASGAFHLAKPSDLIPELQGRLPIRVELNALSVEDFKRILTEPDVSLTKQYAALLGVENLTLEFTEDGIARVAEIAWQLNESSENIGARRLYTVLERMLETISFEASEKSNTTETVDAAYVDKHLASLIQDDDLSKFIL